MGNGMLDPEIAAIKEQCPVELAARIIGQKWTLQIVNNLMCGGTLRFCELQEALGGVNPSTLSSRLKMLEEEGLVQRIQRSTVPPHVEYTLTTKGDSLGPIIVAIKEWSYRWLCGIDEQIGDQIGETTVVLIREPA